jgi:hypothetical protein
MVDDRPHSIDTRSTEEDPMRALAASTVLITTSLCFALPAWSGTAHPWEASLGLGAQFGGTVDVTNGFSREVDNDAGFAMKANLDYFPVQYFGFGPVLSYASTYNGLDGNINVAGFGLELKGRAPFRDLLGSADLLVTPELGITYRRSIPAVGLATDGLGINFGLDLRLRWRRLELFIEPGFETQPSGGNDLVFSTFGPIGYVIVGTGFAFGGGGDSNF